MIQFQLRHLQGEGGALAVEAHFAIGAFEDGCGDRQFFFGVQQLAFQASGVQARQNVAFDDIDAGFDQDFEDTAVDFKRRSLR